MPDLEHHQRFSEIVQQTSGILKSMHEVQEELEAMKRATVEREDYIEAVKLKRELEAKKKGIERHCMGREPLVQEEGRCLSRILHRGSEAEG